MIMWLGHLGSNSLVKKVQTGQQPRDAKELKKNLSRIEDLPPSGVEASARSLALGVSAPQCKAALNLAPMRLDACSRDLL
jgi:hypothetical protein